MIPRERKSRLQCPRNSRQDNMERFSLSELGLPTENKAIQGILCPMGVELCHLLLALEREDGICTAFPTLGEKTGKLAKAMEELAAVARRLSEDSSEEGRMEMCPMGESLLQAGRDMVLAAFQLQEHPDSPWHREHLAAAAKRILMETAKILQLEEAAGMRRITGAASWLLECLSVLRDAQDTPGLLAAFQAFSEAVLLLSHLTAKRLQELGDCPGGKSLAQTLQLLHKCVSLIHTAKQDTLMYSRDSQADLSQDSVFHLTERTIRELLSLLMEPQDKSGIFSQQKHPGGGDHSASLCPRIPGLESAPLLPQQHQDGPSSISPAKQERGNCDKRQGGSSSVSQVTQDMATRMLHMAQFLRRKGPIASKEQFVACARQMVADGQVVVKFGNILAKHCLDQRCSMELLHATEHAQSVSSQLDIVARVKAVTGESKASSELLLSNVQNLIQAVQHVLKAAEAACVKGLGQPPADPEEEEVAAFCQQWRRNLTQHRAKEALNSDRDELGLRKTRGAKAEPTLMSLGQEQPPRRKTIPKHPNPRKGHTVLERHL